MDNGIFSGGPPSQLAAWARIRKYGDRRILRLLIISTAVAWIPLAVLTAGSDSFVHDYAVQVRCLIAIPLLVVAEAICIPLLQESAQHFLTSGLIRDADRPRFDKAIASTRRLRDSRIVEIIALALAYAAAVGVASAATALRPPAWHELPGSGAPRLSPAGWWHAFVSLPLLLVLLLGWLWRLFLWARFLWLMSRLDLKLLPSHPDRSGGLQFVGHSLRAWTPVALVPSVIAAGTMADRIIDEKASLLDYKYMAVGLAAFVILMFSAPLLVFSGNLLRTWRRGVFQYGALADRVGHKFEKEWLAPQQPSATDPLETGAFSATTDLYQVVSNVYQMRFAPIDLQSIVFLAAATLLPYVPLLLVVEPLDVLLKKLAGFLA
jgi:hypothetical protein